MVILALVVYVKGYLLRKMVHIY